MPTQRPSSLSAVIRSAASSAKESASRKSQALADFKADFRSRSRLQADFKADFSQKLDKGRDRGSQLLSEAKQRAQAAAEAAKLALESGRQRRDREALRRLSAMGFSAEAARHALRQTDGDLEAAANVLLSREEAHCSAREVPLRRSFEGQVLRGSDFPPESRARSRPRSKRLSVGSTDGHGLFVKGVRTVDPEEAPYDGEYRQLEGNLPSDSSDDDSVAASHCEERRDKAKQPPSGAEAADVAEGCRGACEPAASPQRPGDTAEELEMWHSNEHSPVLWSHEPLAATPVPMETRPSNKAPEHAECEEELLAEAAQCEAPVYVPPDSKSWDWPLSRHEKKSRLHMVERDMDLMDRKALLTELVQLRGICRRHSLGEAPSQDTELLS